MTEGLPTDPTLKALDANGYPFRTQYFLRRAVGTLAELSEEIRLLDAYDGFRPVRDRFSEAQQDDWKRCVDYLADRESVFKKIRNDIGGHFGFKAAVWAVQNLQPQATGHIKTEINYRDRTGTVYYEFATEVAATAMMRHRLTDESSESFIKRTLGMMQQAFQLSVSALSAVTFNYTLNRFGK